METNLFTRLSSGWGVQRAKVTTEQKHSTVHIKSLVKLVIFVKSWRNEAKHSDCDRFILVYKAENDKHDLINASQMWRFAASLPALVLEELVHVFFLWILISQLNILLMPEDKLITKCVSFFLWWNNLLFFSFLVHCRSCFYYLEPTLVTVCSDRNCQ